MITRTWTATDDCGNAASLDQIITVQDIIAPQITCPADLAVECSEPASPESTGYATGTDNCSATVTIDYTDEIVAGSTDNDYIIERTWSATDDCGNVNTCTQNITVHDTSDPLITCPAVVTITADGGSCFASNVDLGTPEVSDNCTPVEALDVQNDAPATFPVGESIVTWTVTDMSGKYSTCAQLVIVTDSELPLITASADIDQTADAGVCGAEIIINPATATDNCGVGDPVGVRSDGLSLADSYPVGTTTIAWNVADIHGNDAEEVIQTIIVSDDEAPVITANADITQTADSGVCGASIEIIAATATDNCEVQGSPVGVRDDELALTDLYPVGTTTITWTVSDIHGNSAVEVIQTITVTDDEAPVPNCPVTAESYTADVNADYASLTFAATPTDNCEVANTKYSVMGEEISFPYNFSVGMTTVDVMVTDIHNNNSTCSFDITVTDDEDPEINCMAGSPFSRMTDDGVDTYTVQGAEFDASFSDNVAGASISNDYNGTASLGGEALPVGETTIIWTVTDAAGNSVNCTTVVTVSDDEDPEITCMAGSPFSRMTDDGVDTYTVQGTEFDASFSDNVVGASISNDYNGTASLAGSAFPVGTTTIEWIVIDAAGNSASCTTVVTVTDDEDPEITCMAGSPFSRMTDDGVDTYTVQGAEFDASFSDNVAGASISNDYNGTASLGGEALPVGETTIIWTVADAAGNSASCTTVVTVSDDEDPEITCMVGSPFGRMTDDGVDTYTVQGAEFDASFSDNVAGASISNDYNGTASLGGEALQVGETTIIWTVTDAAGNSVTCTTVVTVTDDEDPEISCVAGSPFDRNADEDLDTYTVQGTEFDATFSDNAEGASIVNDFNGSETLEGAMLPVGANLITWTATDAAGNTSFCESTINVHDKQSPRMGCTIGAITQTVDADQCGAYVSLPVPSIEDNTKIASIENDFNGTDDASGFYPVGSTVVIWTAFDQYGNSAQCSMTIIVVDDQNPEIICSGDISEEFTSSSNCNLMVTVPSPSSSDNCDVESVLNDFNGTDNASGDYPVGTTVVTWTATDIHGNTSTCEQQITVKSMPQAIGDGVIIEEDEAEIIDVLANDLDCDDNIDVSTLKVISNPAKGTTTVNADGTITYLPGLNYFGTDYFTYEICDEDGYCSDATVSIQVLSVYDPPISMGDINNTFSGMASTGNVFTNDLYYESGVVSGPSLVGEKGNPVSRLSNLTSSTTGEKLSTDQKAIKLADPSHGTVAFNDDGTYVYTPDADYSGNDEFIYVIDDPVSGVSAPSTVYLRIISTDRFSGRPPVANVDVVQGFNNPALPTAGNLLENDFDVEGGTLLMNTTPVVAPTVGNLEMWADGAFNYYAPENYEGVVSFTYEVYLENDPTVTVQAEAMIVYFPAGQEDQVYGVDDAYFTGKNVTVSGNVKNNDINLSSSSVTISEVLQPSHGIASIDATGEFTYTPDADYIGPDNFTYSICLPGSSLCRNATVYITVDETNLPPVAVDDDFIMNETNVSVLDNDSDPDGDQIAVTSVTVEPEHGTLTLNPDGTFVYTPDPFYYDDDSFEYEICDDTGTPLCDQAFVTLRHDPQIDVLVVPDAFSPNGDGINDYFEVPGIHLYPNAHMEVYNRWGAKLYEKDNYGNEQLLGTTDAWWDGRPNVGGSGDIVPEGTYFVILILDDSVHKGTVFINR